MKKYQLLIVTVTYKPNVEELALFVKSFRKYNDLGDNAKLIIVDSSPNDIWRKEEFMNGNDDIDVVSNPSNPGFGASNNLGFERYKSDYVLFINNDVEFVEPILSKLIVLCEIDNKLGCIGIHQRGGAPSFYPKMTAPKGIDMEYFDDKYHFVSGAFMFFKSSAFMECGRFDPNLFMYFEEFDLSNRLIEKGYHTMYVPELSFWHKVKNRRRINENIWKKAIPSFCYICRKYNLDPQFHSKSIMRRLKLLFMYNLVLLHFKEAFKILRLYKYRKQFIYKEFGVKI